MIGALRDYGSPPPTAERRVRSQCDLGDAESALSGSWATLANIFERHFQIKPTAGRSSRNIDRNGVERHYPIGSPFTAFVIAVCKEAGISPISPPTVADS